MGGAWKSPLLALVTLLLLGPLGCKRSGSKSPVSVYLGAVLVQPTAEGGAGPLDREALTKQAREQLLQAGIFAGEVQERQEGVAVASVRVDLTLELVKTDDKMAARALVRLRVTARPEGMAPAHFVEDSRANAEMLSESDRDHQVVLQRLAENSIRDVLATYAGRVKLWGADHATLHAALQTPGDLRAEAIRVVAARALVEEVPTLIALLSDDDEIVRDAALGALVRLRDRRAVPALTKTRSMRDAREMGKILEALAVLGGQEALDYLAFVADTHENEEVRSLATAALRRAQDEARRPR